MIHIANIDTAHANRSIRHIVEALDELYDARFARSRRTDDGGSLTRFSREINVFKNRAAVLAVGKGDMVELNGKALCSRIELACFRLKGVRDRAFRFQNLVNATRRNIGARAA